MEQMNNQRGLDRKSYERIYGEMTRVKAYGSVALLCASVAMCVVEPIFLGFVAFPVFMGIIAPGGMKDLKREFSKEGNFLRDAFASIGKDIRGLGRFWNRKQTVAAVQQPAQEASDLASKTSRPDFVRGADVSPAPIADNTVAPANSNAASPARKNVA